MVFKMKRNRQPRTVVRSEAHSLRTRGEAPLGLIALFVHEKRSGVWTL